MYANLVAHYKDNPNVEVMIDRRVGPDRRRGKKASAAEEKRVVRDRRRARAPGTFPDTDLPEA